MAKSMFYLQCGLLIMAVLAIVAGPGHAGGIDSERTRRFFSDNPQQLVLEEAGQKPPALKVLKDGRLEGYLFSTFAVSGSLGFSGRPVDIIVGLGADGVIRGAWLARHNEPILVLGISPKNLESYVAGFTGFDIRTRLKPGIRIKGLPDAVAGASISSGVIRDAIIRSARAVAYTYGLLSGGTAKARIDRTTFIHKTWPTLVAEGAIAHRKITMAEMREAFGLRKGANPDGAFIDLYAALLTPPAIGQNLLREVKYNGLVAGTGPDDNLIMIAANGLYSFRGRAWRKSGVFDRIEIIQGQNTLQLKKQGYQLVETLHAAGAPEFREIAVFVLPKDSGFNPVRPWTLRLLASRDAGDGAKVLRSFDLEYRLPGDYITGGQAGTGDADDAGGRRDLQEDPQLWVSFWLSQKLEIGLVVALLSVLTGILFFQDYVARNKKLYMGLRLGFLVTTIVFLGFYAGAQLSVINVLTFIHSLMSGFRWELFLLNPMVFILWGFVALAMLFWGRGVYCGWLCPFGALQELVNKLARAFGVRQVSISWGLHERLWPIKYIAFLTILAVSMSSMTWAFKLAEIEPFKTVIILKFMREWQFVLYPVMLLAAGVFIERFYCRYLCPLGAALAIPARLRMFEWLNRRHQCGRECRICNTTCTVQAINPLGQISPNECIYCLRCQVNYYDDTVCKPLIARKRRRMQAKQAASGPEVTVNAK